MVEFQLADVFFRHLHPQHGQKAQRGGVLHLGTISGKTGILNGGKTKNGGISDDNDNARIFKLYWYKETRTEKSERQGLSYCQVHLNPASIRSLPRFSDLFLAVSRPDSGNCRRTRRGGPGHLTVRIHAHFFSLRTLARQMWSHVWVKGLAIGLCASTVIPSLVMSLLNVPSTPFPLFFSSRTASLTPPAASPTLLTGIRVKPLCSSALGWTV